MQRGESAIFPKLAYLQTLYRSFKSLRSDLFKYNLSAEKKSSVFGNLQISMFLEFPARQEYV